MTINIGRDHILTDTKSSERSADWPYDSDHLLPHRKTPYVTPWEDIGTEARSEFPYNELDLKRDMKTSTLDADAKLKGHILEILSHDDQVDKHQIEVKVFGGDVTLSGWVRDHWMKMLIESLTEQTPGINRIINKISVDPNPDHYPFAGGEY